MHTKVYSKIMKDCQKGFYYDVEKNNRLIKERHISFDEIIAVIESNQIIDILEHPNQTKYPGQKIFVLSINNYIYFVPFVEIDDHTIYLKTAFANRKAHKKYHKGKYNDSKI